MMDAKVEFNLKGLEKFGKDMAGTYRARVGILGDKVARENTSPDGLSNSEIGVVQMFGSLTNNIPPRDFLLQPIQHEQRDIMKGLSSTTVKKAVEAGDIKKVFKTLGVLAEAAVQRAFETRGFGQWAPNRPSTIARKGSSAPLIDEGELRKAVSSDVVKASRATGGGS